jgi:type IX secretion system PorP/SprF family membrane protein
MAFKDEAGDSHLSTTQVNISVSSVITINKNQDISAGIQGGFAQRGVDVGALQWGAEYEENIGYQPIAGTGTDYENFSYGDFSAGLAWTYSSGETNMTSNDQLGITAGIALYHLNQPTLQFDDEELHQQMVAHVGASIGVKNTNLAFAPSVLYLRQGPLSEINVGGLIRYTLREESRHTGLLKEKALYLGSYYRVGDAVIPTLILEIASYSVGFSYDLNLSALKAATKGQGGFEISLRYIAPNSSNSGKYRHKSLI